MFFLSVTVYLGKCWHALSNRYNALGLKPRECGNNNNNSNGLHPGKGNCKKVDQHNTYLRISSTKKKKKEQSVGNWRVLSERHPLRHPLAAQTIWIRWMTVCLAGATIKVLGSMISGVGYVFERPGMLTQYGAHWNKCQGFSCFSLYLTLSMC